MVRSAAVVLAVMLLIPGIAHAQQQAVHLVVDGETLWGLAQRYYSDPFRWPRIYEANRGAVEDPHWIYPGEQLVIPEVTAAAPPVEAVAVTPAPAEPEPEPEPAPAPPPAVAAVEPERTIFYVTEGSAAFGLIDEAAARRMAVPRDVAYGAPWLGPLGEPPHLGVLEEFAGAEDERVPRTTAFRYDRVQVRFTGLVFPPGTELLSFRASLVIPGVGRVLVPTGVLTVSDPIPGGVVALVVDVFERLSLGDYVQLLPTFPLRPGMTAVPASGGADAAIIGFERDQALQSVHDIAFLDQGSDHGVAIGDEYVVLWREETGAPPEVEGRLQVVSVHPDHSSARITGLRNPVFEVGRRVSLDRKMP